MLLELSKNFLADPYFVFGVGLGEQLSEKLGVKPVVRGEESSAEVSTDAGVCLDR